jgi:hypothetical protein
MTNQEVQAYWELASLVKQAADEEGVDLDELAEQMNDEELAEFLDAAMQGALEGAEEDENEYSPFMEKTAGLLQKVAAEIGKGEASKPGFMQTLKEIWEHSKGRHPKIGKYGPLVAGGAGGAGAMAYYLRKKLKKR